MHKYASHLENMNSLCVHISVSAVTQVMEDRKNKKLVIEQAPCHLGATNVSVGRPSDGLLEARRAKKTCKSQCCPKKRVGRGGRKQKDSSTSEFDIEPYHSVLDASY